MNHIYQFKKIEYKAMFISFLCIVSSQSFAQKVYIEKKGIVMVEAENTESLLGEWIVKKDFPNYSGNGYLEFSGGNVKGVGLPSSPIKYTFKITNSGDYALQIRGRSRLLDGETADLANDAWFKLEGDYSVGEGGPPDTTWTRRYTKLFVGRGGNGNWGWGTKYDIKHVQPNAIFYLQAGKTYTLIMAGRSQRFNVDRILIVSTKILAERSREIVIESLYKKGRLR
jgi:hypothetical protein